MEIFLHPPNAKDWKFWSASIQGKIVSLSDYQRKGGKRSGLLDTPHKNFYFKNKNINAVEEFISTTKGLLGKFQHFSNDDRTSHMVISFYIEASKKFPELLIEEFLADIRVEKLKIYYGLPFKLVSGIENIQIYLAQLKFGGFEIGLGVVKQISMLFPDYKNNNQLPSPATAISVPEMTVNTLSLDKYSITSDRSTYYAEAFRIVEKEVTEKLSISQAIACAMLDVAIVTDSLLRDEKLLRYACFSEGQKISASMIRSRADGLPDNPDFQRLPDVFNEFNLNAYPLSRSVEITPIDSSIYTFLSLIYKGYTHAANGLLNDAYIFYIIALDLLFGGETDNNRNIQYRCAVICMYDTKIASSYIEAKKKIGRLYNQRSRFIHQGKNVSENDLNECKNVCNAVSRILFSFRADLIRMGNIKSSDNLLDKWRKDLDLISAFLEAERVPSASVLEFAHIYISEKIANQTFN